MIIIILLSEAELNDGDEAGEAEFFSWHDGFQQRAAKRNTMTGYPGKAAKSLDAALRNDVFR